MENGLVTDIFRLHDLGVWMC